MYTAITSVTTGRTAIYNGQTNGGPARVKVHVPTGGASVFVGDFNKSTPSSFEVEAGKTEEFYVSAGDILYATVATSTQNVSVWANKL